MKGKKILVVEDHRETNAMICAALEAEGAAPDGVFSLKEAAGLLSRERPDLVMLDLNLPDGHGLELCRRIRGDRQLRDIPIIALTAHGDISCKKKGFESGLDQFLTKPIEMEELAMWVRALLRRVDIWNRSVPAAFRKGDVEIDQEAHLVGFRTRRIANLTKREFQLFYSLVSGAPRLFSRAEILARVWNTVAVENLVDTHIFNLRKKLPPELAARISSVPGKGFRYFDPGRSGGAAAAGAGDRADGRNDA